MATLYNMIRRILLYQNGVPFALFSAFIFVVGFIFFFRLWKKTSIPGIIYILVGFTITSISTIVFQIIAISARSQDPDHVFRNHPHCLRGLLHIVTGFAGAGFLLGLIGFIGAFRHFRDASEKSNRTGRTVH